MARSLRAVRRRKGSSQARVASLLAISQSEMSRRERGSLENCSVEEVERWAGILGAHASIEVRVDGQRPLMDARHARLQDWIVGVLRKHGWTVIVEHSFNHYGDRGRVDVLAFHPIGRILLVVEVKTRVDDIGDIVGRLDVKRRVGPVLAREQQWQASAVVPMLLVLEHRTNRRRIADYATVFAGLSLRARAASAWLRSPIGAAPSGVLLFATPK